MERTALSEVTTCRCQTCGAAHQSRVDFCASCRTELIHVFPEDRESTQYDDALEVRLSGGYGMYIDETVDLLLCKSCAGDLIKAAPFLLESRR